MAGEIQAVGLAEGRNYFAVVRNAAGQFWAGSGNSFAAASGITWSAAGVALTADATLPRNYSATFPAGITTAGEYTLIVYERAGASPAVTDVQGVPAAGPGSLYWDGAAAGVAPPPIVDGLTYAQGTAAVYATLFNVTTVSGNTVSFKKRDGTTTAVQVTVSGTTDGVRTASTVT